MRPKYLISLFILFLTIFFLVVFYFVFTNFDFTSNLKVLDKIDGYNYVLEKRDSKLYEENFLELKEILEKEDIDYEKYAKKISILFVVDFYSLNNKSIPSDVGGLEFINKKDIENFKLNASSTVYKYINSLKQYPQVNEITFVDLEVEEDNYIVTLSWNYLNDYGYDNNATITLLKVKEKLNIIEFEGELK